MSAQELVAETNLDVRTTPVSPKVFRSCAKRVVPFRDRAGTMISVAFLTAVAWFLVNQQAQIENMNYRIDTLARQVDQAGVTNAALSAHVDELTHPQRLLNIALNKLHMKFTSPVEIPDVSQPTSQTGASGRQ